MNNIYLVERTDGVSWDEYYAFVCAAPDEQTARDTHPDDNDDWDNGFAEWVTSDQKHTLKVTLVGHTNLKTGVILAANVGG